MRKQRHALELLIVAVCIATLAAFTMGRGKPPVNQISEEEQAARGMSQHFKRGEYRQCLEVSASRLTHDPHDLVAIRYQGMCLSKLGDLEKAMLAFDRGVDLGKGPMDWFLYSNRLGRLHLERARLELQLHKGDAAMKDLDKGLEVVRASDFAPWEFHYLRGLAQCAQGNRETAEEDLSVAGREAPIDKDAKRHVDLKPFDAPCESWCPICVPWTSSKGEGGLIKN